MGNGSYLRFSWPSFYDHFYGNYVQVVLFLHAVFGYQGLSVSRNVFAVLAFSFLSWPYYEIRGEAHVSPSSDVLGFQTNDSAFPLICLTDLPCQELCRQNLKRDWGHALH